MKKSTQEIQPSSNMGTNKSRDTHLISPKTGFDRNSSERQGAEGGSLSRNAGSANSRGWKQSDTRKQK